MFALIIKDETNTTVVEHVSNYADDTVHIPDWNEFGLQQSEYRKSHHLLSEIRDKHPNWKIFTKEFEMSCLFPDQY